MQNKPAQSPVQLSQYRVCMPHSEYPYRVDFSVQFSNSAKHIHKQLIDSKGNILQFPGVAYTEALERQLGKGEITPVVKYAVKFEPVNDGRLIMVWTVRPDGRYWMDSWGFGEEDYESLALYSYIDPEGNFTMPFQLYSIGSCLCRAEGSET